VHLRAFT